MANRLAGETSPYLLQHANNPVDWFPWGDEALQKAKHEDKPIFLSIGYAACHWCHVMEHESFTDETIAQFLNQYFISIKVDREERPDLDNLYMSAVVSMTGQGGWPMSVFLTPDLKPFYGGTYFPPVPRYGMPSFLEVLQGVRRAWLSERGQIESIGDKINQYLQDTNHWSTETSDSISLTTLEKAAADLIQHYDYQNGGWGRAPKFPQPMVIDFLIFHSYRGNSAALEIACKALDCMHKGGLFDVVGGGFHRYSTDSRWLVPHFEKMLYDNALLALAYLHAYLRTSNPKYRYTVENTLDFILRELRHPMGGFYSSLDADSEGEEGKFYLWDLSEIESILSNAPEWSVFSATYPLPSEGNFEGRIILRRQAEPEEIAASLHLPIVEYYRLLVSAHQQLLSARGSRTRPMTDDKVLLSWNALALRAFAEAGFYLDRADYLTVAQQNAEFLLTHLVKDGQVFRSWRAGQVNTTAFLEDYAGLIVALLSLYQLDGNLVWFQSAEMLVWEMQRNFQDPLGGFFDTPNNAANIPILPKYPQDNPIPSGNSLAAHALFLYAQLQENESATQNAQKMLAALQETTAEYPTAFAYWLQIIELAFGPNQQIALVYPLEHASEVAIWLDPSTTPYHPRRIIAKITPALFEHAPSIFRDRSPLNNRTTAYICQNFFCKQPVAELENYRRMISDGFA